MHLSAKEEGVLVLLRKLPELLSARTVSDLLAPM